jgi:tungstate transport system permease protein
LDLIWTGLRQAFGMLASLDPEVARAALLTLKVSGLATLVALGLGIPLGLWLSMARFPGRRLLVSLINTGMGLPPVVVGLFVALFLWRTGPLGGLRLIYSPAAMVIAQVIIVVPIIAGLSLAAFQNIDPLAVLQARALGASNLQAALVLFREARLPQLAAVMAGFGGAISEVGAVLMVGGNIRGQTRVLTTAIVQETRMGRFEVAIALSIVLLALSFAVNFFLTSIQQKGAKAWKPRTWR